MRTRTSIFAIVTGVLLLAGCGQNKVGSDKLFNFTPKPTTASPSPTPAPTIAPTARVSTAPVVAPTHVQPAPTAKQAQYGITINGDNQGQSAFYLPASRVYVGTLITWTNHDSVARSVVESDHTPTLFNSGPITPGGTWAYTASAVGTFNYHDGTRPYAVAYFQAISR